MSANELNFSFSDTIAGYVTGFDEDSDSFGLRTSDGRAYTAWLTPNTFASGMRNFGEDYVDVTGGMRNLLIEERYVFAYGIFYPEPSGPRFEAKAVTFPVIDGDDPIFEDPKWWIKEAAAIADFYLRGQFPDGVYNWENYRTKLSLSGTHTPDYISADYRQETDTISRLVYGLASAYLLTGEDRFLQAAESGTEYLRKHMRASVESEGVVYWYHGMDVSHGVERKIFSSEFGDDLNAIPAYEQIYALAGPTQTYRVTGDPRILDDIERTVTLFDKFYRDPEKGGFFSHLDPVTLDPRSDRLLHNRARKNWNSVGDHAPAYLINALLATGRKDFEDFLAETGDTICAHFPDYDESPFVQERFHEDWSHDRKWKWQMDNAVVGHNLKIAWNLMRMNNLRPNPDYVALATKIAGIMPTVGMDAQRGGWYDVMERTLQPGQTKHRFVWHDRKAWWQQEQGILAYYILAGCLDDPEYLRLARESAAYYNAMFLDHDEGGVYFNVLDNGTPYLVGTERLKASHSMSGYHSMELCYLASTYTNLLVNDEPLELYFKPKASSFADGILRVAPDLLPPGKVTLTQVWIDDAPYEHFDSEALSVVLPEGKECRVKVRLVPKADNFQPTYELTGKTVRITLRGALDLDQLGVLRRTLASLSSDNPDSVVLVVSELERICDAAVRELVLLRQALGIDEVCTVVGAAEDVAAIFREVGDSEGVQGDWTLVAGE
jgi:mannose/cellobiose epimerase-like protein (N-acyl-D-glucosamine 2-epimerase family)/anti-anti-sigma regulatory factor